MDEVHGAACSGIAFETVQQVVGDLHGPLAQPGDGPRAERPADQPPVAGVLRRVDGEHRRRVDRADAGPRAGQPQRRPQDRRQTVGPVPADLPEGVAAQHVGADVVVHADPGRRRRR